VSIGLSLIHAIIQDGNRSRVRELNDGLFLQDELPAFTFFRDFYRRYGGLPTVTQMLENGYRLPPVAGQIDYLIDRCVSRAVYNTVRENMADFQAAIQSQNAERIRAIVAAMHFTLSQQESAQQVVTAIQAGETVMTEMEAVAANPDPIQGVTLGWPGLDAYTSGAQPGEVVTWVARPNVGKSFMMAWLAKEAWLQGHSVLFVTMEMTKLAMMRRLMAVDTGVNPDNIKRGTVSVFGEQLLRERLLAYGDMPDLHLYAGNLSSSVSTVDALTQKFDPDVVIIDAQYLMSPTKKLSGAAKQWESLSEVGKEVKEMAMSRRKPVHQSVQFNRSQKKDSRGDELANIGGTDVVGQISDIVVAISEGEEPYESTRRKLDMVKNREGPKGSITTRFQFEPVDFSEIPPAVEDFQEVDVDWMV
jgi:replicative DNA helicase